DNSGGFFPFPSGGGMSGPSPWDLYFATAVVVANTWQPALDFAQGTTESLIEDTTDDLWDAAKLNTFGDKPNIFGPAKTEAEENGRQYGAMLLPFIMRSPGGAAKGTTTLYRAVTPAELADIKATGKLRNLGSAEGKYFTTSAGEASAYAKQAVKAFGDQPYTINKTDVSKDIFKNLTSVNVDRGIPAWVIPNDRLPGLVPQILDHSPIPPVRF
ncbi:MAG TPA: hypothetical protein PK129_15145, partial [Cellvibrionaceae bacterium]|nr:hypothetical protein [Cellvibrionaceae bacterium]